MNFPQISSHYSQPGKMIVRNMRDVLKDEPFFKFFFFSFKVLQNKE